MRRNSTERRWPEWLEPLRPDDVGRRRMRRDVLAGARPLLEAREAGWFDVAAGWATVLAPVAAAITILFTAIAIEASRDSRATIEDGTVATAVETDTVVARPEDLEYVLQVTAMAEAP